MLEAGVIFGRLKVVSDKGSKEVHCKCVCGQTRIVQRHNLVSGNTKSCGCLKSEQLKDRWRTHKSVVEISKGDTYGRLTVMYVHRQNADCMCLCGSVVRVRKYDLKEGKTSSCGCLSSEISGSRLRDLKTVHGGWGTHEWNCWNSMLARCTKPSAMGYELYGGRGITVCAEWYDFSNFLADVGPAPDCTYSIDRIDNHGGYCPANVRWASKIEQARNRRNNVNITAFGKTQCLAAWALETGLSVSTIRYRLLKGIKPEVALTRTNVWAATSIPGSKKP